MPPKPPEVLAQPVPGWGDDADLRAITAVVPALISFFDADHICRFANEYHIRWYGRSPEELVGLHMRGFLGEEGYRTRLPFLERVAAGETVAFDAKVPHRDGSGRDAAIRYMPRFGPGGFEGLYILVFDVAVHQHRFHSVFDAAAVAFWELDLSGLRRIPTLGEHLSRTSGEALRQSEPGLIQQCLNATRVIDLNAQAMTLFGVDREWVLGSPFSRWCPPAGYPAFVDLMACFMAEAQTYDGETILRRENGHSFHAALTCAFPRRAGEGDIVILGVTDISARIRREEELSALQSELAQAARIAAFGELTASIAHEVNQPLAAVTANGNAALRWLSRAAPDIGEARLALERIVSEAGRASEIVSRTRALAMQEVTERRPFDLNAMVQETLGLIARQVRALGADIVLDLDKAPLTVHGDRIQLQQVVTNLMINAAQAMADAGAPTRRITVRTETGDHRWLSVSDTGPGLTETQTSRLFDPFFTTKPTGMGMGLSVSRTIIEAHGGAITAESPPGSGAVFSVRLPPATGDAG